MPLSDLNTILYRQDIVKDLLKDDFCKQIELFSKNLKDLKKQRDFISKMEYTALKKVLFYKMMHRYTKTILTLLEDLKSAQINSEGFTLLEYYVTKHTKNDDFQKMQKELLSLRDMINFLEFDITLDALTLKIKRYESEEDYTKIVKKVFGKFSKNSSKDIICHCKKNRGINHINAKIYEFVAKLYPKLFLKLENFYDDYIDFMDKTIISFSNEVQFYIAYLKYISRIKNNSLNFSLPNFSNKKRDTYHRWF